MNNVSTLTFQLRNLVTGLCKCTNEIIWSGLIWSCSESLTTEAVTTTIVTTTAVTNINGPCTIDEQCPGISTCLSSVGVCQCLHDLEQTLNKWICTTSCDTDNDCRILNLASVCVNKKCIDSSDPINIIPPFTTPVLPLSCMSDNDCFGSFVCDEASSMCTCLQEFNQISGTCTQSCAEDNDCPSDMVCNKSICVDQITSSGLCETDSDCGSILVCDSASGLCVCDQQIFWIDNQWHCGTPVDVTQSGPCLIDEQCPGVAICNSSVGICTCLHQIVVNGNAWDCTMDCISDTDCQVFNPASICIDKFCTDSSDLINTIPVLTTPALPTTCSSDNDCYGVAHCNTQTGQCICVNNLTWHGTKWRCEKRLPGRY